MPLHLGGWKAGKKGRMMETETTNEKAKHWAPLPKVILNLAELPPDAFVTMAYLAEVFTRDRRSVQKAIQRGELPRPIHLFNDKGWTVRALLQHFEVLHQRAQDASRKGALHLAQQ